MPETIVPGAGASSSTSSSSSGAIKTGGEGGSSSGSEPRIGWAGQEGTGAHDSSTGEEAIGSGLESTDGGEGDFGADEFGGDDLGEGVGESKETTFKDLFEQLKSQDPKIQKAAEKALKRDFFENRRYKQIPGFETPEKAREVVDKLEAMGGLEGIEKETGEAATLWKQLGSGDPALLDALEGEYAEGITKLAPHVLSRYEKTDPQGWAHDMSKVFMATLNSAPAGGISALAAFNAIVQKFPEAAKSQEFQRIAEVINAVNDIAGKEPQRTAKTDTKTTERERKIAEKENALYRKEVSSKVEPVTRQIGINALNQVIKGRQLSVEQKRTLLSDIIGSKDNPVGEVGRLLAKNADFQKNAKALLGAGETDKFIKLVKSAMERTMPLAARNVWKKYYGISGLSEKDKAQRGAEGAARTEAGGGGASSGTIKTATPATEDIDWRRMRAEWGGRDKADHAFLWDRKYLKKGDSRNTYSF